VLNSKEVKHFIMESRKRSLPETVSLGLLVSTQNIHDLADPNILACSGASEPGAKQKK
jgi:hypothetical protein